MLYPVKVILLFLASIYCAKCDRCSHLEELTGLTDLNSVVSLSMYGNTLLNDLWPLVNLAKMTHLNMTGCIGVSDLTPLAFLLNLEVYLFAMVNIHVGHMSWGMIFLLCEDSEGQLGRI